MYLEWKSGASRRNSKPGCVSTMSLKWINFELVWKKDSEFLTALIKEHGLAYKGWKRRVLIVQLSPDEQKAVPAITWY